MQSSPDPSWAPFVPGQPPSSEYPFPPPPPPLIVAAPRRSARGIIIGLSVGLVGVILIVFVTLLSIRTPQGIGATWAITIGGTRATDGGPIAATALPPGDTYLAVDITVKNVTTSAHDFAGYIDFTVTDATGQRYQTTYLPGPSVVDGTIPPGTAKGGTIAFIVPAGQRAFTLTYADPVYGTQHWALSV